MGAGPRRAAPARRRRPPSGVSIAGRRPRRPAGRGRGPAAAGAAGASTASAIAASRSSAAKSVCSSTPWTKVPTCRPPGRSASGSGTSRSPCGSSSASTVGPCPAGRPDRHLDVVVLGRAGGLVVLDLLAGLGADPRVVAVQGRQGRVGGAPPGLVQRAGEPGPVQRHRRRAGRPPRGGGRGARARPRPPAPRRCAPRPRRRPRGCRRRRAAGRPGRWRASPASSRHSSTRPSPDHSGLPGRRVPGHDLVLGAGHRDVQQPQLLAPQLVLGGGDVGRVVGRAVRPPTSSRRPPVGVVEHRHVRAPPLSTTTGRGSRRRGTRAPWTRGWSGPARRRGRSRAGAAVRRRPRRGPRRPGRAASPPAPVGPRCSPVAAACSSSARCSRSASRRSPPSCAEQPRGGPRAAAGSTGWSRRPRGASAVRAHRCTSLVHRSQSSSVGGGQPVRRSSRPTR